MRCNIVPEGADTLSSAVHHVGLMCCPQMTPKRSHTYRRSLYTAAHASYNTPMSSIVDYNGDKCTLTTAVDTCMLLRSYCFDRQTKTRPIQIPDMHTTYTLQMLLSSVTEAMLAIITSEINRRDACQFLRSVCGKSQRLKPIYGCFIARNISVT